VLNIHSTIAAVGGGIWLVGGAVREAMRGRVPKDHDIATTLQPDEIEELFEHTIPTGKQFGTMTVVVDGINHEVTTLRCESGYQDGRHPDSVDLTDSLSLDLERRDFTINAMAVDIGRKELYDPHSGLSDLAAPRLRAVGSASLRLSEDGLRVMRAYRFLDQGDGAEWRTDLELELAMMERQDMLQNVAMERIWHEFRRISSAPDAGRVLARMAKDGVLDLIIGGNTAVDDRRIRVLRSISVSIVAEMRFAVLLKDRDKDGMIATLKRLKAPNAFIARAVEFHSWLGTAPIDSDEGLMRLFRNTVGEDINEFLAIDEAWQNEWEDIREGAFEDLRTKLRTIPRNRHTEPLADGNWLMQQTGLGQGRRLGRLKNWLHRIQIERDLASLEEVEEILCTLPWQHGDENKWPSMTWP
jgi:tRNA nucleotidyltransferase/poly(A) polymerase